MRLNDLSIEDDFLSTSHMYYIYSRQRLWSSFAKMLPSRVNLIIIVFAALSSCTLVNGECRELQKLWKMTRNWFDEIFNTPEIDGQKNRNCVVPRSSQTNAVYKFPDQNDVLYKVVKYIEAPPYTSMVYRCVDGYMFESGIDEFLSTTCTGEGSWQPSLKTCHRVCPELQTTNVDFVECESPINAIDKKKKCLQRFLGTEIFYKCKPLHALADLNVRSVQCSTSDAQWKGKLPYCTSSPDCGVPVQTVLIKYGAKTLFGQFPWHVAIYSISRRNLLICGGTLIQENLVLTAAHCFFDYETKTLENVPTDYVVVVAKMTRLYDIKDNGYQKTMQISEIVHPNNKYNGQDTHGSDIAILILKENIETSLYVRPACFEKIGRTNVFKPQAHEGAGFVTGWGLDGNDQPSDTLRMARQRFVDYNECSKEINNLSSDKFCGRAVNRSQPSRGDSGGGLFFKTGSPARYYIRGLVSFNEALQENPLTVYTDISYHADWISFIMMENRGLKQNIL